MGGWGGVSCLVKRGGVGWGGGLTIVHHSGLLTAAYMFSSTWQARGGEGGLSILPVDSWL